MGNIGDLGDDFPQQTPRHDKAGAAMSESEAIELRFAAQVLKAILGHDVMEPMREVRPHNVAVGLGEDIPVHIWTHLPRLDSHPEELVLVENPRPTTIEALDAVGLADRAVLNGLVHTELVLGLADGLVDSIESIVYVVLSDLLLLLRL